VITITEEKKTENTNAEQPKPSSVKIIPDGIGGDGMIYFDILRDEKKVGKIGISKYEEEEDGENVTIIKAKLIPAPAFKAFVDQGLRPIECVVKKEDDLYTRIEKCFKKMDAVFEVLVGGEVDVEGEGRLHGAVAVKKIIAKNINSWNAVLDELRKKADEEIKKKLEKTKSNKQQAVTEEKEKLKKICLEYEGSECVETAIIRKTYDLIEIYRVRPGKNAPRRKRIAKLPLIKKIYDPSGRIFAAFDGDGKILEVAPTLRSLLEALIDEGYIVPMRIFTGPELQTALDEIIDEEYGYIDAGITMDGIIDPRGVGLDLEEWPERIKVFEEINKWIEKAYRSDDNRRLARANVAFLLAKVLSPAVRSINKIFVDNVIWNVGKGGEGKSTLVEHVLLPLLGVDEDINDQLYVCIKGPLKSMEQARNLIALNRMPLILDEQNKVALLRNVDIIVSATVGRGIIGIHASRYGGGIGYRFKSYRGMIIFTNTHFLKFLREAEKDVSDYALARRVIELEWHWEEINPEALEDLPEIKPILGILDAVWKRHKEELLKTSNIVVLTLKLLEFLEKDYNVDLKVYKEAVKRVWEIWKKGKTVFIKSDEDLLIERALEISRKLLGDTNITGLRLLESIIENPQIYGIKFTYSKSDGAEMYEISKLKGIICKAYGNPDPQDYHMLCGTTRDVKPELYSLDKKLREYYETGYIYVVIKARGPLCPGMPRQFLGAPVDHFSDEGAKFNGYKIPLSKFMEIFISKARAEEEPKAQDTSSEKQATSTGPSGGDGEKSSQPVQPPSPQPQQQPESGSSAAAAAAADINTSGRDCRECQENRKEIDTAIGIKDFQQLPSNDQTDHSKSLKSDTANNNFRFSQHSRPQLLTTQTAPQPQPTPSSIGGGVRGFEALKKVIEKIEPGCYPEDELRQKLGELYDVVVGKLGIAKDKKICLGVEG
jgi:hypothetical protein